MKATRVKLVQMVDGKLFASETAIEHIEAFMSARDFTPCSVQPCESPSGIVYREEIAGQPVYAELQGPMYDGPGIVRYEDSEANSHLST
jgi:hypothetical protein